MNAFLITGASGSGKSAVAAKLAERGFTSIDADYHPGLSRWVDQAGRVVSRPDAPTQQWLEAHYWVWNTELLIELLDQRGDGPVFVCGNAANLDDCAYLFDHVFLLEVDEATMLSRLDDDGRENDFGRSGDTRAVLIAWRAGFQRRMRAAGAIVIDATQPLSTVVDSIIAQAGIDQAVCTDR